MCLVYPVGEFINDELLARNWSVEMLARAMGCDEKQVQAIIDGKRKMNQMYAKLFGKAFNTSWQLWMRLSEQTERR